MEINKKYFSVVSSNKTSPEILDRGCIWQGDIISRMISNCGFEINHNKKLQWSSFAINGNACLNEKTRNKKSINNY